MSDEQGSLERVLTRLGYLRPSLVEKDELGNYLHQCATEGLQAILHIFCGLQRPPYNQVSGFLCCSSLGQFENVPATK